jgi:DNA-binding protein HU-beta
MNKSELVAKVAETTQMTKKDAGKVVDAVIASIKQALIEGDNVQLLGFGTFETRHRAPRVGRNPKTGEVVHIEARTVPVFRPGKYLKEAVQ